MFSAFVQSDSEVRYLVDGVASSLKEVMQTVPDFCHECRRATEPLLGNLG